MPPTPGLPKEKWFFQARSQDRFGGCRTPKWWTFLNLTPLSLLQKPHFVAKSGSFCRFGGCIVSPHPLTAVCIYLFIYLFIFFFAASCMVVYSLSRQSFRELPIKKSLDFRGESILTPSPMPLYIIFTLSWSW